MTDPSPSRGLVALARALARAATPPSLWSIVEEELREEVDQRSVEGRGRFRLGAWVCFQYLSVAVRLGATRVSPFHRGRGHEKGGGTMAGLLNEIRITTRTLLRRPLAPAVMIVTVVIGIVANAAVFDAVSSVFLRPLPYAQASSLFRVYAGYEHEPGTNPLSPPAVQAIRDRTALVADVGAWENQSRHVYLDGRTIRVEVAAATASLFRIAGIRPALGRHLVEADEEGEGAAVAVLSDDLWTRLFGRDPEVVGRVVEIDGQSVEVVGVASRDMRLPLSADLWMPLTIDPVRYGADYWGWEYLDTLVRLHEGVTAADATVAFSAELARQAPRRAEENGHNLSAVSLRRTVLGATEAPVRILFIAVTLIALIGAVNVTILSMSRLEARRRDFDVRRALGASQAGIVRGVASEALIIALIGIGVGLWLATLLFDATRGIMPEGMQFLSGGALSGGSMAYGAAIALAICVGGVAVATLLSGTLVRGRVSEVRGAVAPLRGSLRRSLLIAELALTTALLVGVGVTGQAFRNLIAVDPGFTPQGRVMASVELRADMTGRDRAVLLAEVLDRAGSSPNLAQPVVTSAVPLTGIIWHASFELLDVPEADRPDVGGNLRFVSPGYFRTLGIPVMAGRPIGDTDGPADPKVVVIDQTVARRGWGSESPIGARIEMDLFGEEPATVVGVVGDVRDTGLHTETAGHVYMSYSQAMTRYATLVALVPEGRDSALALADLRRAVLEVDERTAVLDLRTGAQHMAAVVAGPRVGFGSIAAFGGVALMLSLVGIYGVFSFAVAQRRSEIGIRQALGARPADTAWMFLKEVGVTWIVATILGTLASGGLTSLMRSFAFNVAPLDLTILAVVGLLMGAVAVSGAAIPLAQSLRTDPTEVIRREV